MQTRMRSAMVRGAAAVAVAAAIACGGGATAVEGTYAGGRNSFFEKLIFMPEGRVGVTLVGVTHQGTFVVDGGNVTITAPNGQQTPLKIASNGCLEGGETLGTYCKSGDGRATTVTTGPGTALAATYEATTPEGSLTLEFQAGRKVSLTMSDASGKESADATYQVSGDRITINNPRGESTTLTRTGDALEGNMGGVPVRFNRK